MLQTKGFMSPTQLKLNDALNRLGANSTGFTLSEDTLNKLIENINYLADSIENGNPDEWDFRQLTSQRIQKDIGNIGSIYPTYTYKDGGEAAIRLSERISHWICDMRFNK